MLDLQASIVRWRKRVSVTTSSSINLGLYDLVAESGNIIIDTEESCTGCLISTVRPASTLNLIGIYHVDTSPGSGYVQVTGPFIGVLNPNAPSPNNAITAAAYEPIIINTGTLTFEPGGYIDGNSHSSAVTINADSSSAGLVVYAPAGSIAGGVLNARSVKFQSGTTGGSTSQTIDLEVAGGGEGELVLDAGDGVFTGIGTNSVLASGNLTIGSLSTFTLYTPSPVLQVTSGGTIEFDGSINLSTTTDPVLETVNFSTLSGGSDITLAGPITMSHDEAEDDTITVQAGGNINYESGILSADNVVLQAHVGNIGGSAASVAVATQSVSVETDTGGMAGGNVYVNNSGTDVSLIEPSGITTPVAGSVLFTNSGSSATTLSVPSTFVAGGSITLQSFFYISVSAPYLTAQGGALTLLVEGEAFAGIDIQEFVQMTGSTVTLGVNPPISVTPGTAPSGVTIMSGAGTVDWGTSPGVTVHGSGNTVYPQNHDIIFDVHGIAEGITLEGGVLITSN